MKKSVASVALPVPINRLFDYEIPPELPDLKPGQQVRVLFGKRKLLGIVMDVGQGSDFSAGELKPVTARIEETPALARETRELLTWVSTYYRQPIGEVVALALPVRVRQGRAAPRQSSLDLFFVLSEQGRCEDLTALKRAPAQQRLIVELRQHGGPLSQAKLLEDCGTSLAALKKLVDRGLVVPASKIHPEPGTERPATLNEAQNEVAQQVVANFSKFYPVLLFGVTGSGKTEVYIEWMKHALSMKRQILMLVPEIGLTPQLLSRVTAAIDARIVTLHSGLSAGERHHAWLQASAGNADIVIGTRSSVFTSLPRLGLVLVDEEHDSSYRQQDGVRYSARDLAVYRAKQRGCPVILGSATPALETLQNARSGKYHLLHLRERAKQARLPEVKVVDTRALHLTAGMSQPVLKAIRKTLDRDEQILLFHNRRGFAPVLSCYACGWVAQCHNCDANMTWHQRSGRLWCHHCGAQRAAPSACPDCAEKPLNFIGQGTERVEEALKKQFADASVLRVDRDTTRQKGSLQQQLEAIRDGHYSILVGTQMLAKGHDFPNVTLVVVLDIDQALFGADYRSMEHMAQLLVQVAGRAGRASKPGTVLAQTRYADHPLLQKLLAAGYEVFANELLDERRMLALPPFAYQALLRSEAVEAGAAESFLRAAVAALPNRPEVAVLGPVPAPMERRAGRYRYQVLCQSESRRALQQFLADWEPVLYGLPGKHKVRWSLDVDPLDML